MEQALAVAYSLTYVCASREARLSLSSLYPEVPGDRIVVASADRTMATLVSDEVDLLVVDARSGRYDKFFAEWRRLRDVQATVDFS
jgi:hypothetical protein